MSNLILFLKLIIKLYIILLIQFIITILEQVSTQKHLRGGVKFLDSIPKNPSGKILRRELKTLIVKSKI